MPCLVWYFSCRCYRVDRLFHENSKHFPHEVLGEIFNRNIEIQLRSSYLSGVPSEDECLPDVEPKEEASSGESWVVRSVVFSPDDIGIPTKRKRRYSSVSHSSVDDSSGQPSFRKIFFRKLAVDVSIFFPADWSQQSRLPVEMVDLSAANLARLEGHYVHQNYDGQCMSFFGNWQIPLVIVD